MTLSFRKNTNSDGNADIPSKSGELPEMRARWEKETLEPLLAHHVERRTAFLTDSGREIPRVVTPSDLTTPGSFDDSSVMRGIHSRLDHKGFWKPFQFTGAGLANEVNQSLHRALSQGQTEFPLCFDGPTIEGIDSDEASAERRVGLQGVAIDTLADMEDLLEHFPLDQICLWVPMGSSGLILWAMMLVTADRQGVAWSQSKGILEDDQLSKWMVETDSGFSSPSLLRITGDAFAFAEREVPGWARLSIGAHHVRGAGGNASQEIAFAVCAGLAYLENMISRGISMEAVLSRLSGLFDVQTDFFEEIAKLRAFRRIWAHEMRKRHGPLDEVSLQMSVHCRSAASSLSTRESENNMVRVSWQVLTAALGGAESIYAHAMDEIEGNASDEASEFALRTQQVIAHESGIGDVIDAFGGSYYLEWLTEQIEQEASMHIRAVEYVGGLYTETGRKYLLGEVQKSKENLEHALESGEKVVIGVNKYADTSEQVDSDSTQTDIRERQRARLAAQRERRDEGALQVALGQIRKAAETGENLMPSILECVRASGTLGEMVRVMQSALEPKE